MQKLSTNMKFSLKFLLNLVILLVLLKRLVLMVLPNLVVLLLLKPVFVQQKQLDGSPLQGDTDLQPWTHRERRSVGRMKLQQTFPPHWFPTAATAEPPSPSLLSDQLFYLLFHLSARRSLQPAADLKPPGASDSPTKQALTRRAALWWGVSGPMIKLETRGACFTQTPPTNQEVQLWHLRAAAPGEELQLCENAAATVWTSSHLQAGNHREERKPSPPPPPPPPASVGFRRTWGRSIWRTLRTRRNQENISGTKIWSNPNPNPPPETASEIIRTTKIPNQTIRTEPKPKSNRVVLERYTAQKQNQHVLTDPPSQQSSVLGVPWRRAPQNRVATRKLWCSTWFLTEAHVLLMVPLGRFSPLVSKNNGF